MPAQRKLGYSIHGSLGTLHVDVETKRLSLCHRNILGTKFLAHPKAEFASPFGKLSKLSSARDPGGATTDRSIA
jgi:hypothetical protein